ncbi:MAG: rod shape-determining protein MreC [Candidatus Paceibacterota bacterium]
MMNSRQTSNIKLRLIVALIIFIASVVFWRFFPTPIQLASENLINPLLKTESFLYNLTSQNQVDIDPSLKEELDYLRAENATLLNQLNSNEDGRIVAGVIGRPSALPYDVIVIDRGEQDGVIKDAPVYADQHRAIGFVATVYKNSSVVILITTPGFTSTVFVYGPNIYTTAEGMGGGVVRIHVPQGIDIKNGDIVAIPSLSSGVYGSITAVDSIPSRSEQYGYVTSDIPINSLRYVSVGKRPLTPISFEEARATIDSARRELLQVPVPEGVLVEVDIEVATSTEETLEGDVREDEGEVETETNL